MSQRRSRASAKQSTSTVPKPADVISERSQSEYPTPSEALTQTTSRSQTTRPMNRTRMLYSVVPDSAVLTPIRRPDQGGKSGRSIEIYVNHFRVSIDDAIVNQYDVEVSMVRRDGKLCPARKDERWETFKKLSEQVKNFPLAWYDEGKCLYTRELLTDFDKPYRVTITIENEQKTFVFQVLNLVRQEKIGHIFEFINGKTSLRPRDPIRILETLFKQNSRNELICIKNKFYSRNQNLVDLRDGRGMASGFHQALCLTRCGPTLNVNLAFACFYLPLNFVDFACRYLRKDITKGINESELHGIKKLFKNLPIETTHAGRPLRYRVKGFGQSAEQLKFNKRTDTSPTEEKLEKEITVNEYFAQKYQRLKYPHLPCVDARNGGQERTHWLPMEVVKIVEWERAMRPLDSVQRALVSKTTIIKPNKRYDDIMKIIHQRNFPADPYLKALNIKVDINEMIKLKARILPSPQVKYRGNGNTEVAEQVSAGKWSIRNRFHTTSVVKQWGMIYIGTAINDHIRQILQDFENQLPQLLSQCGIRFESTPKKIVKPARPDEIEKAMKEGASLRWQIALVILNDVPTEAYDLVKQWGNQKLGLTTQCISFQALERNAGKHRMYVQNLSQKINAKLGGINGIVNLKQSLSRSSNEDLFMFFGADVTHTTTSKELPSIASVVGSCDPTCSRYVARICEQYPTKNGRCSIEIIKELDRMVVDLLRTFAQTCGNRLPNRIVFYRDGVDDGNFQKVLDNEVQKFKTACRIVYGNNPLPKLTYIIVKKRHHTRFFFYDGQFTNNIEAGTVIDQEITHPSQFDFYLCSQAAIMGTSRPALYHVLHDENGFSSDDIQQLTYWLCHTDARCTKSVSIPAPTHYAHLAAYASRSFDFEDALDRNGDGEDDDDELTESDRISLEDIQTKVVILNEKIQNNMWFV